MSCVGGKNVWKNPSIREISAARHVAPPRGEVPGGAGYHSELRCFSLWRGRLPPMRGSRPSSTGTWMPSHSPRWSRWPSRCRKIRAIPTLADPRFDARRFILVPQDAPVGVAAPTGHGGTDRRFSALGNAEGRALPLHAGRPGASGRLPFRVGKLVPRLARHRRRQASRGGPRAVLPDGGAGACRRPGRSSWHSAPRPTSAGRPSPSSSLGLLAPAAAGGRRGPPPEAAWLSGCWSSFRPTTRSRTSRRSSPRSCARIRGSRCWWWTTARPTAPATWPTGWGRRTRASTASTGPTKEGLGKAYLAGFRWALERDYDFIFEMDADFSHDPKYLPNFLTAIEDADVVIGSRYKTGVNVINWPMSRLLLSFGANHYARWITGLPLTDSTGGFKCFRRSVLATLELGPGPLQRVLLPDRDELPGLEAGIPAQGDSDRLRGPGGGAEQDEQADRPGGHLDGLVAPAPVDGGEAVSGMTFYKMSGSGNDFVMLDGRETTPAEWTAERIRGRLRPAGRGGGRRAPHPDPGGARAPSG